MSSRKLKLPLKWEINEGTALLLENVLVLNDNLEPQRRNTAGESNVSSNWESNLFSKAKKKYKELHHITEIQMNRCCSLPSYLFNS